MGSIISLEIELNDVKAFLDRVYGLVDSEYKALWARAEAGKSGASLSPRMKVGLPYTQVWRRL